MSSSSSYKFQMQKSPTKQIHPRYSRKFFNQALDMTLDFVQETLKGQNKVIDLKLPAELQKLVRFEISDEPITEQELLSECKKILDYQVKPYHPHFHNKLFGGFDQYSVAGAMMSPCINGTTYTYEVAPCFSIMENQVYEHMRKIFEWQKCDGIMTPGGSFANFYAIQLARHDKFPDVKQTGTFGMKPMQIFTSDVSHYSIQKGAILCGIGLDNVIKIATDDDGRMIPEELDKAIHKCITDGNTPLMVNATVGTTAQGSIDPVQAISQVCQKHNVWLHLDAALGGSFWISETLRRKIGSCKKADSVAWDPHKGLLVPLQASFFFCKHDYLMSLANSTKADCLFHKQRASYDCSLDTGDKSLQCGRVIDIMKVWVYLKGNGWKNVGKQVQMEHELALFIKDYVIKHPQNFKMAVEGVDTFNVSYWAIPDELHYQDYDNEEDYFKALSDVTVLAKKYMIEDSKILIGYQKSKGQYYYWRNVMSDPYTTKEQVVQEMELTLAYCNKAFRYFQDHTNKLKQ